VHSVGLILVPTFVSVPDLVLSPLCIFVLQVELDLILRPSRSRLRPKKPIAFVLCRSPFRDPLCFSFVLPFAPSIFYKLSEFRSALLHSLIIQSTVTGTLRRTCYQYPFPSIFLRRSSVTYSTLWIFQGNGRLVFLSPSI